ncbi:MAG: ABC transporter permease [Oligoflexia bacterium]|nr:ABC transporter permease [Oligoflexia bacterium]
MSLDFAMWEQMAGSTLRVSTPLLFAVLGGLLCERAGVVNIALEGLMLVGAFAAVAAALATGSPWTGAAAGAAAGLVFAAIYALMVVRLRANQIVAGTAINMLAAGVTPFLCKILYDSSGASPNLPLDSRFAIAPVWFAWILVVACWSWLHYTPSGLWVRFAGENPEALDTAGVSVNRVRWLAVIASGAIAGLGGASLSIFLSSSFTRNMTAGRGFMALAALIFGKWKPIPAAAACLLFGFADAAQIRLQGVTLWGEQSVPVQFIQILPYLLTVLVLAGVVGKSRSPKSLGLPFHRG